ncbi:hypothetical protein Tco_0002849 [Tanacetum coccineum]
MIGYEIFLWRTARANLKSSGGYLSIVEFWVETSKGCKARYIHWEWGGDSDKKMAGFQGVGFEVRFWVGLGISFWGVGIEKEGNYDNLLKSGKEMGFLEVEIRRSSGIDDEVVQDQRQRDDNDLQDERQDQPKEEEVEPRRSKRVKYTSNSSDVQLNSITLVQ